MSRLKNVWSCGGGVQSAAIAALIVSGGLPKPDVALMVDTGREKETTWRYVSSVIRPELARVGVPLEIVHKDEFATVDLYAGNGDLLLPAYTEQGKLPTFCSNEWKSRVAERWLRSQGYGPNTYRTWIGISCDELKRVRADRGKCYPLIDAEFKLYYQRHHCVSIVERMGWPPAPRSSCWMCPNQRDEEWQDMTAEDFERACALEEDLRQKDPGLYLHKSRVPLRMVTFGEGQGDEGGCMGMCFV